LGEFSGACLTAAQEPLRALDPIAQAILKTRILLSLFNPIRNSGPNHVGNGLILHPSHQFEVICLAA